MKLAPYGINVNAVAPGSTLTPPTERLFYAKDATQAEMAERMLSHVPLGKPGKPQDVANAVLFLCGDESKYITGHVLVVDGGWTCGYMRDFWRLGENNFWPEKDEGEMTALSLFLYPILLVIEESTPSDSLGRSIS